MAAKITKSNKQTLCADEVFFQNKNKNKNRDRGTW